MEVRVSAATLPHSSRRVRAAAAAFVLLAISLAAWAQPEVIDVGQSAFTLLCVVMVGSVLFGAFAGAASYLFLRNSFIRQALLGAVCIAMLASVLPFWTARSLLITAEADKCAGAILKTAEARPYDKECRAAREMPVNALGFGWINRKVFSTDAAKPLDAGTARWLSYLSVLVWPAILFLAIWPWLLKHRVPV